MIGLDTTLLVHLEIQDLPVHNAAWAIFTGEVITPFSVHKHELIAIEQHTAKVG